MPRIDSLDGMKIRDLDCTYGDLADGKPIGDILTLLGPNESEADRYAAAQRIARNWLTRRYVFHPDRWQALEGPFRRWKEDRDFGTAWADLVVPEILEAGSRCQGEMPVSRWYKDMRRHLRKAVERELLGRTLDSGDPVEKLSIPDRGYSFEEALEMADLRIDDLLRLQRVPEQDREILELYYLDYPNNGNHVAELCGMKPAALRKRVERIRKKIAN